MSQFLVLIYDDPAEWKRSVPKKCNRRWRSIAPGYRSRSRKTRNGSADDPGRVIRSNGGKPRVTDGPYSETKEVLGGFYLIEAENYDAAVALAMDHPHLEYGGTLEIRELWHP